MALLGYQPAHQENVSLGLQAELAVILNSIANLKTYPWVDAAMKSGALTLHGWHLDFATGTLLRSYETPDKWVEVSANAYDVCSS